MNASALLLMGLSLGLSNFAAAIGIGLTGVDARTRIRTGLAFGFFEALMPVLGLVMGHGLAGSVGALGRGIGAILLVLTGVYALWQGHLAGGQGWRSVGEQRPGAAPLLLSAFALSIDNLVVGFALSFLRIPVVLAAAVIATISVLMSLIGLELGNRLGEPVERWSEQIGGVVLILVGLGLGSGKLN